MKIKLSLYLLSAFLFTAMVSILTISLFINIALKDQFREFAIERQEAKGFELIEELSLRWEEGDGWTDLNLQQAGMQALDQGFILRIYNQSGELEWDTSQYDDSACMMKQEQICSEMAPFLDEDLDNSRIYTADLLSDGARVGEVELVSFTPFYFEEDDLNFISTVNRQLLIAAVLSIAAAILLALIFSRLISSPIVISGTFARSIADGKFTSLACPKFAPSEIQGLINSINHVSQSLQHQGKLRKQLSADVAHELRTPLASLQGYLEAMIDGVWPADEAHLKSCHQEIIRITSLVSDLEKLAEYETDLLQLKKSTVSIRSLIQDVVILIKPAVSEKGIRLTAQLDDLTIEIDEDKMKQVFVNLLANSLKYTPAGGTVTINAVRSIDSTVIYVEDSGSGIPSEDIPFVFERFYRVDKSRTRISGGSGIGLAIAKEIIEAHNGSIEVDSTPNVLTRFTITLPV